MDNFEQIKKICNLVSETKLESLRLQEEILLCMVKKKSISLREKTKAFNIIIEINKTQLEILGHKYGYLKIPSKVKIV